MATGRAPLGIVFQFFQLLPPLTLLDSMMLLAWNAARLTVRDALVYE